jgi:uncharacterized protein YggE
MKYIMIKIGTRMAAVSVILMIPALILGCSQFATPSDVSTVLPGIIPDVASNSLEAPASQSFRSVPHPEGVQQRGIWVLGTGKLALEPNLAIMTAGVEIQAKTVAEAQERASVAMNAVMGSVKDWGIQDRDIQTAFFNIQPAYEWHNEGGGKQVLVGYKVTNTVRIKFRRLDTIGPVIDDIARAGGDLVRIQGISFTVENFASSQSQAREMAVKDALNKARQMATLTDVTLGTLLYITEVNSGETSPVFRESAMVSAMEAPTPIIIGQQEISVTVQAVFAIQ